MTRRMADSTNLDDIPIDVFQLIGYYVDGSFAATPAQIARHAGSVMVPITVGANPQMAVVGDCETGDYLPWEMPGFCVAQQAKGIDPSVYVSYDLWAPTQTEFRQRGLPEPHWWIALWDGSAVLISGAVAKQWGNPNFTHAHYDESIVEDFWPGVDHTLGGAGLDVKVQPPFTVVTDPDTHWYGTPGGTDEGVMGSREVVVQNVTADGQWFEFPGSTWWFAAAKSSLVLSSGGVGPPGPTGPAGPQGPQGPQGPPGPEPKSATFTY